MSKQHSPRFLKLVESVRPRISEITPGELRNRQEANPDLELIDIREESEYSESHVAGARHLGKGIIERDIESAVPDPGREIVLYCGGGFRSALAADNLQKMGYRNVYSLAGGFRALTEGGFDVDSSQHAQRAE